MQGNNTLRSETGIGLADPPQNRLKPQLSSLSQTRVYPIPSRFGQTSDGHPWACEVLCENHPQLLWSASERLSPIPADGDNLHNLAAPI